MSDGKRINWRSISYFYAESIEGTGEQGVEFTIKWKFKASIKSIRTTWTGTNLGLTNHFRKLSIVELKDDLYVNLDRVQIVEEEAVHGPVEKVRVTMFFEDGLSIFVIFEATKWAWWKTTYL